MKRYFEENTLRHYLNKSNNKYIYCILISPPPPVTIKKKIIQNDGPPSFWFRMDSYIKLLYWMQQRDWGSFQFNSLRNVTYTENNNNNNNKAASYFFFRWWFYEIFWLIYLYFTDSHPQFIITDHLDDPTYFLHWRGGSHHYIYISVTLGGPTH